MARRLVALVAAAALLSAVCVADAAAPRKSARYAGKTKQGLPISFRVARSGKTIRRFRLTIEMKCTNGDLTSVRRVRFRQTSAFIEINRDHTFSGDVRVKGDRGDEVRGGRLAVNGRFVSRRRARGSVRERLRVAEGLRCDSGQQRFTARRR